MLISDGVLPLSTSTMSTNVSDRRRTRSIESRTTIQSGLYFDAFGSSLMLSAAGGLGSEPR